MTEKERIEKRARLDPQQALFLDVLMDSLSQQEPLCGFGTPTRIQDHLEGSKWLTRAVVVALLAALASVAAALCL